MRIRKGGGKLLIVCIHQGGELYGSDRSFLQAVKALRLRYDNAYIKVILATDGPLVNLLQKVSDEIVIRDILVLRLAKLPLTLMKLSVALPYYLVRGLADTYGADIVYINTSVIADFILLSRISPQRHILHIREIPRPKVMGVIRFLCRFSGARILYNSHATARAFALPDWQMQNVVYNGSDIVNGALTPDTPPQFTRSRPLRMSMLGRVSGWKGQDLLIAALAKLPPALRDQFHVRIVGSVYGDDQTPLDVLRQQIIDAGLSSCVSLEPFRDDPQEVYQWSDVCIVPSRLPEPFGRVAIEAMAWARPVIAAAHGGLVEIVEDGVSGWLFPPNDEAALASLIERILADPTVLNEFGGNALLRFRRSFSTEAMQTNLLRSIQQWYPHLGSPNDTRNEGAETQ